MYHEHGGRREIEDAGGGRPHQEEAHGVGLDPRRARREGGHQQELPVGPGERQTKRRGGQASRHRAGAEPFARLPDDRARSQRPSQTEVQIPSSLASFAAKAGLSFRQALTLLEMQQQIVAHRSATKKDGLEKVDWQKFYEAVKEFLE